jgi:hypothetical protein
VIRRHLFLATARATFGEILVALDVARELHRDGDTVAFLHPAALSALFQGLAFAHGTIDLALMDLPRTIRDVVRARDLQTITLVDVSSVIGSVGSAAVRRLMTTTPARVLGIDLWNLPETDLTWDVSDYQVPFDPIALEIPSLRPCPVARPEAPGAYRALPTIEPLDPDERVRVRAELGIAESERLVITTTGTWQLPLRYAQEVPQRLAVHLPGIFALLLPRLPDVRLFHVGPEPFAWAAHEPRYRHSPPLAPALFRRALAASDLLLSVNAAATSVQAAIAVGVPAAVVVSSLSAASLAETGLDLATLPADLRAWLEHVMPLRPFRVCPVGLYRFMAPVLANNPYAALFAELELAQLDATVARIRSLCEQPAPEWREARHAYLERIAQLPDAKTRFRELCA